MATYNFNKKELLLQVSNTTAVAFERPMIRIQLKELFSFSDQEKWMIVSFICTNRLYLIVFEIWYIKWDVLRVQM